MKDLNIIRVKKSSNYVMLNKQFFNNKNLSLKAKGLLGYLLSLPDDWKIYVSELTQHHKDGKYSIHATINELIKNNYMHRERIRKKGKITGMCYKVFETPQNTTLEPETSFPYMENQHLLINNITNKKYNKITQKYKSVNSIFDVLLKKNIKKDSDLYKLVVEVLTNFKKITGKKPNENDVNTVIEILSHVEGQKVNIARREKIIIQTISEIQAANPDKKINSMNYFKIAIINKFKDIPVFKLNNKLY